jgi:hypothetical protein
MEGRFTQALHQRLDPAAAPELLSVHESPTSYYANFSPRKYPDIEYKIELSTYRIGDEDFNLTDNGLGVDVVFYLTGDLENMQSLKGVLGDDEFEEMANPTSGMMGFDDPSVTNDCFNAVARAIQDYSSYLSSRGFEVLELRFSAASSEPSRVKLYRFLADKIAPMFGFGGGTEESSDGRYQQFIATK